MTTADRIRALLGQGLTDAEIARRADSDRAYVRAVRSRLKRSPIQPGKPGPKPGPRLYRRKATDGSRSA